MLLGPDPTPAKPSDPEAARLEGRVDAFLAGLKASVLPGTAIIDLHYRATDPDQSAKTLNALCDGLIEYDRKSKSNAYAGAIQDLEKKIEEMKDKLKRSENELLTFATDGKEFVALSDNAQEFYKALDNARREFDAVQKQYDERKTQVAKLSSGVAPDVLLPNEGATILQLRQKLYDVEERQAGQKTGLLDKMPRAEEAAATRASIEKHLEAEMARIKERVRLDFERLAGEREKLLKTLKDQQEQVPAIQERVNEYNIRRREVDIDTQMVNTVMQRWKAVSLSQGFNPSIVSVIQSAKPPIRPLPTNRDRTLLLGGIIGILLGLGVTFFLNYMDMTFRTPLEISKVTRLPILGQVPYCHFDRRTRKEVRPELVTQQRPYSGYADNFRGIRTIVQSMIGNGGSRKLLVTSAMPVEGKTMFSTNLAISLAQKGARVLLIDADLKKPSLHKVFGIDLGMGLADLLKDSLSDYLDGKLTEDPIQPTAVPRLYLLTAGSRVANPIDLLDSEAMRQFLNHVDTEYDYAVFDAAPVAEIADTSALGPYVDGTVLILRPSRTPRRLACEARDRMKAMGGRMLGIVLNFPSRAEQRRFRPSFWFRSGYTYGYGYGYGAFYGKQDKDWGNDPGETLAVPLDVKPILISPNGEDA